MNLCWPVSTISNNASTCVEVVTDEENKSIALHCGGLGSSQGWRVSLSFNSNEELRQFIAAVRKLEPPMDPPRPMVTFTTRHVPDLPF